jgi:hypothetical protein
MPIIPRNGAIGNQAVHSLYISPQWDIEVPSFIIPGNKEFRNEGGQGKNINFKVKAFTLGF